MVVFESDFWREWFRYMEGIIVPAIGATLRMLTVSMVIAMVFGFLIAVVLVLTALDGLKPNKYIYGLLDFAVNMIRAFPIIILIVAISPITRMLVGTSIGEKAAIFPLALAATPFIARVFENNLRSVDKQLIEAAQSFGASSLQIVMKVMVREAFPSMVLGVTLSAITFLSATTLAGAVGAGGIGAVALTYGYQSFNNVVLYTSVLILLIMVQAIQSLGNWIYKKVLYPRPRKSCPGNQDR